MRKGQKTFYVLTAVVCKFGSLDPMNVASAVYSTDAKARNAMARAYRNVVDGNVAAGMTLEKDGTHEPLMFDTTAKAVFDGGDLEIAWTVCMTKIDTGEGRIL